MSSEQNPWKLLSSKYVYENSWIRVREDQVIRPDGNPGIYSVVETKLSVAIVALTSNLEIYLVGQYRYPTKQYSWEIIAGGSDGTESALECAKRELKEEAGLTAKKWTQLGGEIQVSNCISTEICNLFLAEDLEEGQPSPEGTEVLQLKRLPINQALDMLSNGEIQDAASIIGLYRIENLLKNQS